LHLLRARIVCAPDDPPTDAATAGVLNNLRHRDVLGGIIHEYDLVAA
jgi:hypothetical protein